MLYRGLSAAPSPAAAPYSVDEIANLTERARAEGRVAGRKSALILSVLVGVVGLGAAFALGRVSTRR